MVDSVSVMSFGLSSPSLAHARCALRESWHKTALI